VTLLDPSPAMLAKAEDRLARETAEVRSRVRLVPASGDARGERGVLGVDTRADTVAEPEELLRANEAEPEAWFGVWLFSDWMDVAAADLDEVNAVATVELEASRPDPYRQLSRVFHLVARTRPDTSSGMMA
jgi:hypothetical protein